MTDEQLGNAEMLLLRASRACGFQARRDEVQAVLDDPEHGPLFAEWIRLRLGSDTLLTDDELQSYTELDRTGRVDHLAGLHNLTEVQAVTEDELRLATEELKRSTEHITKETEMLQQQRNAMLRLARNQAEGAVRRDEMEQSQRRKIELERRQLTIEVQHISQDIQLRLLELEQHDPAVDDGVARVLQSDDELLSGLQKLGWELDQSDPNESQAIQGLRDSCMRLTKTAVETVRTRLDRIYLNTLAASVKPAAQEKTVTSQEVNELQEEVESLYSEISSVAQMSMDKQYLEPVLRSIAAKSGHALGRSASSLGYINECLSYLVDRMAKMRAHVESHKSYQAASTAIVAAAKTELAVETAASSPRKPNQVTPASSVRARNDSRTARTKESFDMQQSPLETLLRDLAISLPPGEVAPRPRAAALSKALAERRQKCRDVSRGVQQGFEISVSEYLKDAKLAIQLLRDSLLAESPFGQVTLVDGEIEGSILVLGQEVDKAKGRLATLEGQSIGLGNKKRDDFVRTWGP